jgi:hypothetical protein
MLKTCRSLNTILKILNENDFKKNKNSTFQTLIQNFESILTDTIQIQIINKSFMNNNNNRTTTMLFDEEPQLIGNDSMNLTIQYEKSIDDKLLDAFENIKTSFKTFFLRYF